MPKWGGDEPPRKGLAVKMTMYVGEFVCNGVLQHFKRTDDRSESVGRRFAAL